MHIKTINLRYLLRLKNDELDLLDGFYSIGDIQDYFDFIIKKHENLTENNPVQIYPNRFKTDLFLK